MALIELLRWLPENQAMREWWTLHHREDHNEIINAIQSKKGVSLVKYQISPYNKQDEGGWLLRHQALHNDFNSVLGLPGSDLQNIDDSDEKGREEMALSHFREHQQARQALGI